MEPVLRVLGPLEVNREDQVVAIGGPNVRVTLALMVAHRSTDTTVERWAMSSARVARTFGPPMATA